MEHFFVVLEEAFLARLLPGFSELALTTLKTLHPEQYGTYAVAAGTGGLLAAVVLYAIGVWLRGLPKKISTEHQQQRIGAIRKVADQWLVWLLILSPTPVGGILIIASGFFAMPRLKAALAITAAEVLWRASPLF